MLFRQLSRVGVAEIVMGVTADELLDLLNRFGGSADSDLGGALLAARGNDLQFNEALVEKLIDCLADNRAAITRPAADLLAEACGEGWAIKKVEDALSDPKTAWPAAFALANAGRVNERVVDVVLDSFGHAEGDVRWAALALVRRFVSEGTVPIERVVALVGAKRPEVRRSALYCLRDCGCNDARLFARCLNDGDVGVRVAALAGIRRADPVAEDAVLAVIERLKTDDDIGIRRAAASILGVVGGDVAGARQALEDVVERTTDSILARAASRALERLGSGDRAAGA